MSPDWMVLRGGLEMRSKLFILIVGAGLFLAAMPGWWGLAYAQGQSSGDLSPIVVTATRTQRGPACTRCRHQPAALAL